MEPVFLDCKEWEGLLAHRISTAFVSGQGSRSLAREADDLKEIDTYALSITCGLLRSEPSLMSVAPDLLTLGIELELVVQGDQETIRQQMATFLSSSLNVAVVAPPDPRYRDAKAWILKTDGSIRWEDHKIQPPPRAAIEIVSPVFTDRASQRQTREKWQRDLKEVFETVKSNYTIGVNKSTAYHIHVGVGVSGVRLEHRFNLVEMKKIATAYVRLEAAIDKLHAPHRADKVTNPAYYVNTVVGNRTLKGMLAEQVVELIWSTQTTEALVKILNPEAELGNIDSRRYYRVNFCSNNVHGTIEFRQHEGTDDLQAIYAWAELVLAFVRSALGKSEETMKRWGRHPEALQDFIGPDVHGKMVRSRERLDELRQATLAQKRAARKQKKDERNRTHDRLDR